MARLLWLADVLRGAGLTVVEEPGWKTRGDDSYGPVKGVIIHETRGSATSTDAGEIGVLINGRVGLSGPIAQLYLSRTGVWHVIASGTCHHVKTGWGGPFAGLGNDSLLGVEAQHAAEEDWTTKPAQYTSYVRGVAAILAHTGWPPPVGHKEHQPGDKPDPEFNMDRFRAAVAADMEDDVITDTDLKRIATAVQAYTDAGSKSFHDAFFGDVWPASKAAAEGVVALNAKVGAISAVDPAAVAAALAGNAEFVAALAGAISQQVGEREAAADRARADVLDG